jgi:glucose 1-dehydrogenase
MTQKVAVITGAAQGIGYATAEALRDQGLTVVITDINEDGAKVAAEKLGCNAQGYLCDVSSPVEIEELFNQIEKDIGIASVLVNNAGIAIPSDFLELSIDHFQQVIDVNLTGTFVATQRMAKSMIRHGLKGAIINMSSINAQVAIPTIAAYCASKGGVMQLTKAAALALAPYGIRVNAVGPGSIDTAMMSGVNSDENAMRTVLSRTPLGRIGNPREVGDVVAFLASDKASYITGETIYIDGGRLGMNYTC